MCAWEIKLVLARPLHDASGNIVLDDCSKADLLNNYFASLGIIDNDILPSVAHPSSCACTLQTVVFTEANVTAAIRRLKIIYLAARMNYRLCCLGKRVTL